MAVCKMEAMENLLNTQFTILILILVGYVLSKQGLMNTDFRKALTNLVINFILPCNIILSFQIALSEELIHGCLAVCVASAITQDLLIKIKSKFSKN